MKKEDIKAALDASGLGIKTSTRGIHKRWTEHVTVMHGRISHGHYGSFYQHMAANPKFSLYPQGDAPWGASGRNDSGRYLYVHATRGKKSEGEVQIYSRHASTPIGSFKQKPGILFRVRHNCTPFILPMLALTDARFIWFSCVDDPSVPNGFSLYAFTPYRVQDTSAYTSPRRGRLNMMDDQWLPIRSGKDKLIRFWDYERGLMSIGQQASFIWSEQERNDSLLHPPLTANALLNHAQLEAGKYQRVPYTSLLKVADGKLWTMDHDGAIEPKKRPFELNDLKLMRVLEVESHKGSNGGFSPYSWPKLGRLDPVLAEKKQKGAAILAKRREKALALVSKKVDVELDCDDLG